MRSSGQIPTEPAVRSVSLDALTRRYRAALMRFFSKRVPQLSGESEDLTQEVFMRLAQRAKGEEIANVEGYLFQTASNVLRDRLRRGAVRHAHLHIPFDQLLHADADISSEQIIESQAELAIVIAAINRLPELTQRIFVLHRFEGLTQVEIARRLGLSLSWIETHIARGLAQLIEETRRYS